jgi:hypothetical protein
MSSVFQSSPLGAGFRRIIGVGGIALVLLLNILSVSPDLHRAVHDHQGGDVEDACAVVQFSQGVSPAADAMMLVGPPIEWRALPRDAVGEVSFAAPRFLLLPGRGPPVS